MHNNIQLATKQLHYQTQWAPTNNEHSSIDNNKLLTTTRLNNNQPRTQHNDEQSPIHNNKQLTTKQLTMRSNGRQTIINNKQYTIK